jgi:GT2 family glycosyltransferase
MFPHVRLIENKSNLGFGRANNQGVEASAGAFCWLLNSDTVVPSGRTLETMHRRIISDPLIGVVGCRLFNSDGSTQLSCMRFPTPGLLLLQETMLYRFVPRRFRLFVEPPLIAEPRDCDWVFGASMLIRRDLFRALGGFDAQIWMYGEEMELCYRIRCAGFKIIFDPTFGVIHLGEGSWLGDAARPILLRHLGLLYFYRKHYGNRWACLAWVAVMIGCGLRCLVWLASALMHVADRPLRQKSMSRFRIHASVLAGVSSEFVQRKVSRRAAEA